MIKNRFLEFWLVGGGALVFMLISVPIICFSQDGIFWGLDVGSWLLILWVMIVGSFSIIMKRAN